MMKMIFENAFMCILDFELTNSDNASASTTGFSRPMPMSAPDLQCRVFPKQQICNLTISIYFNIFSCNKCLVFPKQQMLSRWNLLVCHSTKLKYVGYVTPLIPWQEKLSSAMRSRIKPPSLIFWRLQIFYTLTIKLFLRHFWWASKNLIEWIWNIIYVQATTNWKKTTWIQWYTVSRWTS